MYPTQGGRSRFEGIVQAAADTYLTAEVVEAPVSSLSTLPAPLVGVYDPYYAQSEPFKYCFLVFTLANHLLEHMDSMPLDWVTIVTPLCRRRTTAPAALCVCHEVRPRRLTCAAVLCRVVSC